MFGLHVKRDGYYSDAESVYLRVQERVVRIEKPRLTSAFKLLNLLWKEERECNDQIGTFRVRERVVREAIEVIYSPLVNGEEVPEDFIAKLDSFLAGGGGDLEPYVRKRRKWVRQEFTTFRERLRQNGRDCP